MGRHMAQRYGLEIECFGLTEEEIAEAITSIEGLDYAGHFGYHGSRSLGLRCKENNNGHLWVSERDGSLVNTAGRGMCHEIISPVMEGEAGLRTVGKVMTALSRAGAQVNRHCGLHTTFGIENSHARFRRMSAKKQARVIAAIVDAYDYFEVGFDSLVSASRRYWSARPSGYASPIRYPSGTRNAYGKHTDESAQRIVERGVGRGYLNIGSFLSKGIIEFRQHNGTLNRWKIYNWSLLLQRLVQWAVNDRHVNHGCDLREFPPTLAGLLDCVAAGSDLRRALTERASSLGLVRGGDIESPVATSPTFARKAEAYTDYQMARIVAEAGSVE